MAESEGEGRPDSPADLPPDVIQKIHLASLYPAPVYTYSTGSSAASVASSEDVEVENEKDQDWGGTDDQADSDDEEYKQESEVDSDDFEESSDTEDSDYAPKASAGRKRKAKSMKSVPAKKPVVKNAKVTKKFHGESFKKRESYQDKIDRLKRQIADVGGDMKAIQYPFNAVSSLQQSTSKLNSELAKALVSGHSKSSEKISFPSTSSSASSKSDKSKTLDGRSSLLLQQMLLQNQPKGPRKPIPQESSSVLFARAQEIRAAGESVLKTILTSEPVQEGHPATKPTMLRQMLEEAPAPLSKHVLGMIPTMQGNHDNDHDQLCDGYAVYVDNASSESDDVQIISDPELPESSGIIDIANDSPVDQDAVIKEFPESQEGPVDLKLETSSDSDSGDNIISLEETVPVKSEPETDDKYGHQDHPQSSADVDDNPLEDSLNVKQETLSPTSNHQDHPQTSNDVEDSLTACTVKQETSPLATSDHQAHPQSSDDVEGSLSVKQETSSPMTTGDHLDHPQSSHDVEGSLQEVNISVKQEPTSPTSDHPVVDYQVQRNDDELNEEAHEFDESKVKMEPIEHSQDNCTSNIPQKIEENNAPVKSHFHLRSLLVNCDQGVYTRKESFNVKPTTFDNTSEVNMVEANPLLLTIGSKQTSYTTDGGASYPSAAATLRSLSQATSHPKSASDKLRLLSKSTTGINSNTKETILRSLIDRSSTSLLQRHTEETSHAYNTRHKRKQDEGATLLEKALKTIQPLARTVASPGLSFVSTRSADGSPGPLSRSSATSARASPGEVVVTKVTNPSLTRSSTRVPEPKQNSSCSQQLLNIIRNVGAEAKPKVERNSEVNSFLKCMLNDKTFTRPASRSSHRDSPTGQLIAPIKQEPETKIAPKLAKIKPKPSLSQSYAPMITVIGSQATDNTYSGTNTNSNSNNAGLPGNPYQCRLCGSAFSSTTLLEQHMQVHFGSMPFGCSLCPQSFGSASLLENHMKLHQTSLSPALVFKCTECGEMFDTEAEHNAHRVSHNVQHTQHLCTKCLIVFSSLKDYESHSCMVEARRKHCELCDLHFASEDDYKKHVKMGTCPSDQQKGSIQQFYNVVSLGKFS